MNFKYYDKILLGMISGVAGGAAIGVLTAFPVNLTVAGGSLISTAFMYQGLFKNAPVALAEPVN